MLIFNIQYLSPKNVDAFLELDKKVYDNTYQVGKEATLRRLEQNNETDITVMDEDKMVGYISLCPIPTTVFSKIIHKTASEEAIESSVVSYQSHGYYHAYLSSIVVDKQNYPRFSGKELFLLLEEHLVKLRKKGVFIHNIIAVAVSIAGRKTLQRMRFKEVRENVFIYDCLKQGVCFVSKSAKHLWVSILLLTCNKENHWGSV